ncbi:MAG TPA: hypothetical protein P5186_02700 [Candidatus Paceibacterota bacterium]|nr:hypothetical protein [Verrucomicrobiota bacterium]HRY46933.1 hypothetical protein [Candidatus Paceibacterota bacterium]
MNADVKTSFLTYYIRSLAERTRAEKKGTKFGFDWIIYNLALAEDLIPHRLPFFRGGAEEISKTKTEAEFGIDAAFVSRDGKALTIFVLKDEPLSNSTWTQNDFDGDLRRAAAPDLAASGLRHISEVRVILAYNKDEDQTGIDLFERQTKALGTKVGDNVPLRFERWNLTRLVEQVKEKLLTPSLVPQHLFSLFSYICSQFADFRHGSDEWTSQLVPNWRRFLADVLSENADERTVRLLPVALLILREQGGKNRTSETGWIDLAEWAMLCAWHVHQTSANERVRVAVSQMWVGFYLAELERFYEVHSDELATKDGLAVDHTGSYVDSVVAAVVAFWHIARLGILAQAYAELMPQKGNAEGTGRKAAIQKAANRLARLLNANPATFRPLLDLHHIELFLIWRTFWQSRRLNDIFTWLHHLRNCLLVRRAGSTPLPFLEGGNSLSTVLETIATEEKPPEFCDNSSMLLLCIMEWCFSLPTEQRNQLIELYYRQIVLGIDNEGKPLGDAIPIDLLSWVPREDWGLKVLGQGLADDGECQSIETLGPNAVRDGATIANHLEHFIRMSRSARKNPFPEGLPISVIVLACLKHRSPLPAELWRHSIFVEGAGEPLP